MNLKQLEYFVQVAELGSFSKAAVVLDIAQPALSRQVRSLETELHQQLFLRNGRGVTLTDAGKRLFDHSVAVLQLMAHAREDLGASRNEPVGRVTIGLPPSMGRQLTLPLIDRFKKELPAARLAIVEGLSTHIVEWVTTGRIDIGLVYNPEAQPGLEITPLLQEQLGLVSHAPKGKRKRAALSPLPMKELSRYPLIVPERNHAMRRLLERLPERTVTLLDTGCCGMAGAFGMMDSKYELSVKVAEPLIRAVRNQPFGTTVVASGASCRQQIQHLAPVRLRHMVEVMAEALA